VRLVRGGPVRACIEHASPWEAHFGNDELASPAEKIGEHRFSIQCRAVVRQVDGQDAIVIRPMIYLTLSYDHRVIDDVTGNSFLHRVRELVEEAAFTL
jgi:hypothetical protein